LVDGKMVMSHRMTAVVCYAPKDYRLEEVPVPKIGRDEVLVKIGACGICASDVKCYHGAPRIWGDEKQPRFVKPPVVPGHEFIGEVTEIGPEAKAKYELDVGDKAIAEQILPCWNCRFCNTGHYWMCQVHNIFGFQGGIDDGGFAEYMKFPKGSLVHKVPAELSYDIAAMIEPLACGMHAVDRADPKLDDVMVIAGMGPIGLCMLQVAKLRHPKLLIGLDAKEERLKAASKLGADLTINVTEQDPVREVMKLTDSYGCDIYLEATGNPDAVIQGLQMIRKLGRFVEFSVLREPVLADWSIIGDVKELDILGSHLAPYTYPRAIRYLNEGTVKVDQIVTHKFPLTEFHKALEYSSKTLEGAIKVLTIP
jgi:threonine dehydrogenase-like Zn-dependent dehydrogenase